MYLSLLERSSLRSPHFLVNLAAQIFLFLATASVDQTWHSSLVPSAIFAFLLACLEIPTSSRSLTVELVTKALHPHLYWTHSILYIDSDRCIMRNKVKVQCYGEIACPTPQTTGLQKELHAKRT